MAKVSKTWEQALAILSLAVQKCTSHQQITDLLRLGYLADLFEAKVPMMDRDDFRRVCGLEPLAKPIIMERIIEVEVNWDLDWHQAIERGAPTTGRTWDIYKVASMFPNPPGKNGITKERVLLVNRPGRNTYDYLGFDLGGDKPPIHPRVAFAIGERLPQLCEELGLSGIGIVVPRRISFGSGEQIVSVWYGGCKNWNANLASFGGGHDDRSFFAFSC